MYHQLISDYGSVLLLYVQKVLTVTLQRETITSFWDVCVRAWQHDFHFKQEACLHYTVKVYYRLYRFGTWLDTKVIEHHAWYCYISIILVAMSKEDACLSRLSCQPSSALLWVFFLVTAVAINGILTLSGLNPLRGKSFWCCCLVQLSDRRCHFFWESVFAMFDVHKTYMNSWCLISYWLAKADRSVHLWENHFLASYFN